MKLRTFACLIGAIAISSAPFVLAVSGGGFPSNPQFTSVGVGSTASGVSGSVQASYIGVGRSASSGITRIVTDNGGSGDTEILSGTTTAGNPQFRAFIGGVTNWSFGGLRSDASFNVCNAATLASNCYFNIATTTGVTTLTAQSTSQDLNLKGFATGAANNVFLGFLDSAGTRTGYVGDSSGGNSFISLGCDIASCTVELNANATAGTIALNGATITTSATTVPWTTQSTTTSAATSVGCTAALGSTWRYVKTGNAVVVSIDPFQCTSNSTAFSFTSAVPAAMQPARNQYCAIHVNDNSINQIGLVQFSAGSTTAQVWTGNTAAGAWTASGGKGLGFGNGSCSYLLN